MALKASIPKVLLPVIVLLAAIAPLLTDVVLEKLFPREIPKKGSIATYTIRARSHAVFDLHESVVEEAKEVRASYVPIYHRDGRLLRDAKAEFLPLVVAHALKRAKQWKTIPILPSNSSTRYEHTDAGAFVSVTESSADTGISPTSPAPIFETDEQARLAAEVEALFRGIFQLLIPYYSQGVVADNEYPAEKETIRVFSKGRYVSVAVSKLVRFSTLDPKLRRRARQFFFKTDPELRRWMIDFLLQRLPPNLTYAKENDLFISDISQVTGVKTVLIRRGEILARRGQVIGTRTYYAIRASAGAASKTGWWEKRLGATAIMIIAFAFLSIVLGRSDRMTERSLLHTILFIYCSATLLGTLASVLTRVWPITVLLLPQAMVAIIATVVFNRSAGLIAALLVAFSLANAAFFDFSTFVIAAGCGTSAAFIADRRRPPRVFGSGIVLGLCQTLLFEASRAAEARPASAGETIDILQAFAGGFFSSIFAQVLLIFVQHWVGQAGRGTLAALSSYDAPLMRRMSHKAPEAFARTIRIVHLAEQCSIALNLDVALTRVIAMYHDIGTLVSGAAEETHVSKLSLSARLLRRHKLPREILKDVEFVVRAAGQSPPHDESFEYDRMSLEAAIVVIVKGVSSGLDAQSSVEDIRTHVHTQLMSIKLRRTLRHSELTERQLGRIEETILGSWIESVHG